MGVESMQDRYAGDVGDFVKLGLLRALSPERRLGVAWYRFPDEDHNGDGRHISYLEQSDRFGALDPDFEISRFRIRRANQIIDNVFAVGSRGERR